MMARQSRRRSLLDESSLFGAPMQVLSATNDMVELCDDGGQRRRCIDYMSAYGAVNFGHRNPKLEVDVPADLVGCFYPPEADTLSQWLCDRLELPEHKVLYQVGGSFAVSTAMALAQHRRPGAVASIRGGFHGLGIDALEVTTTQNELALQGAPGVRLSRSARVLELGEIPKRWDDISAVLFEPVQGARGYVPLDPDWLRALEASAHEAGALVIADEIQAGFYRHGSLSVARSLGLRPDIVLFSKSLTNGRFPLSAVVYDQRLEDSLERNFALAHTFQTAALGYYAGMAVARYIDEHPIDALAADVAASLADVASRLAEENAATHIHAIGPSLSFELGTGRAHEFVTRCFARGLLVFTGGSNGERVRVAPPLTTTTENLASACQIMVDVASNLP